METIFRVELNLCGCVIIAAVIWLFLHQIKKRSREDKVFLSLSYLTLAELILDSIFWLIDGKQFFLSREFSLMVNTLYYFLQLLICFLWMLYCKSYMRVADSRVKTCLLNGVLVLGVVILIVNLWTGCVFTVDDRNVYQRDWGVMGSLEAFCCLFYPLYCIGIIIMKMIRDDQGIKKKGGYFLLVSVIPILSSVAQWLVYGVNFIWIGVALALLLVLVEIEIKHYQKLQDELTEQKIQIILSQIQPHFLYNTLGTIQGLCLSSPETASDACANFSKFLRGNMDSLNSKLPIPFARELIHVKNYIALEKLRYGDNLTVLYEIQEADFLLPSLTIQPIMENAIKYGIHNKMEPGTVLLKTEKAGDQIVITIKDDGRGFDVDCLENLKPQDDGRTHVGLMNVKSRIEILCNGTLDIYSRRKEGTTVTIRIPLQNPCQESG